MRETGTENRTQPTTPEPWEAVGLVVHLFWLLLLALFASLLLWGHWGVLDVISIAPGEVVPSSKVQKVQHLEGGIIQEILVHEGDVVQKDQPLVILDAISSTTDVAAMRQQIDSLRIDLQRLHAEELDKETLSVTTDTTENANTAGLIRQATTMFNTRRRALLSQQSAKRDELTQRKQELIEIQTRQQNQKQRLNLLQEQITISNKMLATETTSRYEHLNLLKESSELRSRTEEDEAALVRLRAAVRQSEEGLAAVWNSYAAQVQTEIKDAQRTLNDLVLRVGKFEDSMHRTVLRSPMMGVVKTLYAVSQGGVIAPGGTVLDIVPGEDRLIVEARLPAQDVGHVRVGQTVIIRLASAEAARFGKIQGIVSHLSPDTTVNKDGVPYYIVHITTEKDHFQRGKERYSLVPGVVVSAGILTGQRTVLEYLFSPFQRGMEFAFSEP